MKRLCNLGLVMVICLVFFVPAFSTHAAPSFSSQQQAQELLASMSIEERVGQLFLVTFQGDATDLESDITDLILNYKVGGVSLAPENGNFPPAENTPEQIATLSNSLQRLALLGFAGVVSTTIDLLPIPNVSNLPNHTPVPMFITVNGTDVEASSLPGFTPLPSPMAIGATWDTNYATQVGQIIGQEMEAVGVNFWLNPPLDVVDNAERPGNAGTQVFGGNPFWVGQMAQAYIAGIHEGSDDRIAIIGTHFPGNGSADRPVEQEIPTVRKSLEQLRQTELPPFFAVTDTQNNPDTTVDGLLTTHIRYQGFQGNIQPNTAPVSFDAQALTTLFNLPELAAWHGQGGLIVSDNLGVRAVQRFYDASGTGFPHRQVAKDALLAGNDLLYLADFAVEGSGWETELANIQDTIVSFRERYRTDPTFQQRVDVAVTNILQTKLRLYGGDFSPNNVLVNVESVAGKLGQVDANLTTLAQDAITLISPSAEELPARLPAPPALNENIVIFTDVRNRQQCPTCVPIPLISQFALAQRMDAFYGEAASGQVRAEQIQSYTFADLSRFLGGLDPLLSDSELESTATPTRTGTISDSLPSDSLPITATLPLTPTATPLPTPTPLPARDEIEDALTNADWIVFAALDTDSSNQDSLALNEFLANRPDLAQSAKIVVFEFGAPYYLDTTEISKLTAYYGVFSHTPPFVDAAVGVLFQERPVFGRSPVDIPSIDYRLDDVTQPDPMQVIELFIVVNGVPETSVLDETVEGVVGDTLRLQTGVILDGNGQIVPDRTIVTFTQFDRVTGEIATIAEVPTKGGIATFDYILEDREGQRLRITASSGQAVASQEIDVSIGDNVIVLVQTATPAPTPIPTVTPMPTALPTDMPTITPSPTVALTPTPDTEGGSVQIQVADLELLLSLVAGLSVTSLLGVFMGRRWEMPAFLLVRRLLWGIIAGILTYLYIILQLPYSEQLVVLGNVGVIGATVAGGIAGMIAQWFVSLFR